MAVFLAPSRFLRIYVSWLYFIFIYTYIHVQISTYALQRRLIIILSPISPKVSANTLDFYVAPEILDRGNKNIKIVDTCTTRRDGQNFMRIIDDG